jgi:hypothetical protein
VSYVLAGYSQGAWAVHEALHDLAPTGLLGEVSGVVLFGDPKFLPNEPIVRDFRSLDTNSGMATAVDPKDNNVPAVVVPQTGSWCFPDDPVCQVLSNTAAWLLELKNCASGSASCAHFQYTNQETRDAAIFLNPFLPTASLWPHLALTTPPEGKVGSPYTWAATATPPGSVKWTWAGSLPPGLSFSSAGVLSGIPTQAGTFTFDVKATAAYGRYAKGPVRVTVNPGSGGGTWTPVEAPLPPNAISAPITTQGSDEVSCPSASACAFVDSYVDSTNTSQLAVIAESGASWTATEAPLPFNALPGLSQINAMACATASNCVAVGEYFDAEGNPQAWLLTGSGESWTWIEAPLPHNAGTARIADLFSVSCAATCVAIGSYNDATGSGQGLILTGSGPSWTAAEAPLPANASPLDGATLYSVACPSATVCVADGYYIDTSHNQQGVLLAASGASWTATEAPLPANADPNGPDVLLDGVACASASKCVATGDYNSSGQKGLLLTRSGTSWIATEAPVPPGSSPAGSSDITSVACAPASECVAISSDSPATRGVPLLLSWSGTSWTATNAPLPTGANPRGAISLRSVACPSATACVVVGVYSDNSGNADGLLLTGAGISWTATQAPLPANASGRTVQLNSVACSSVSACVATGHYIDTTATQRGLILTGNLSG